MADRLHLAATLPPREAIEEALKLAVLLLKQAFVSPHAPLPLDPVEEALLILAGTGVSGHRFERSPLCQQRG
jgi:hypothetical protein